MLLKVIEYPELTLEKCEFSIIIRLAKAFGITAFRIHYRVHKSSLMGPNFIRLSSFHTLKINSITDILNIYFQVTIIFPN